MEGLNDTRAASISGNDVFHHDACRTARAAVAADARHVGGVAVALVEAAEQHQVRIVVASVPGNHLHLVVHDEMGTLSAFMKHAFSVIGRFCNARDRVKGISRVGRPRLLRLTRPRHSSRLVSVVFVTSQA